MVTNRLVHWLGAAFIAGIVTVLLLGAAAPSIYTPWTAFKGTNGTSIKTNPASPVVIIDGSPGVITASNSLVAQISAAQVWTNDQSLIRLIGDTNSFQLSLQSRGNYSGALIVDADDGLAPQGYSTLGVTCNTTPVGSRALYGLGGSFAAYLYAGSHSNQSESVGCFGQSIAYSPLQYGVVGQSENGSIPGQTNVGVAGSAQLNQNSGVAVGVFAHISDGESAYPLFESAALLVDNHDTAAPIFICRTNNGSFKAFEVDGYKTTNATPFDAAALLSAYSGVATLLHANSTNSLITVGGSPFNYTNTAAQTIVLYLDANGATTAVKLNGTQIFASLVAGDHTLILKPGAYATVTYSLATPVMTWTEL